MRNGSGYYDNTAAEAIANAVEKMTNVSDADSRNNKLMKALKNMIDLAGFDLVERIAVKDRKTGKVYK